MRNVGCYRMQKLDRSAHGHALADPQDRRAPLSPRAGDGPAPPRGRGRPRRRPGPHLRGDRAACPTGSTSGCSRASSASAPSRSVPCKTVDLEVPADADFVLEGYVDPQADLVDEGPFGDHTGYYTPVDRFPRFHVTALTHREGAVYPATLVGPPPMEDAWLGKATERLFLPMLRLLFPEVVDMNLPVEGAFHNLVLISIKKQYPFHAARLAHGLWGAGQMTFSKVICVLDDDVDVQDLGAGRLAAAREPRPQARLRVRRRAHRSARSRREPGALGQQGVHRRHAEVARGGVHARVAGAVPHERRGRGARRRDVGGARDRRRARPESAMANGHAVAAHRERAASRPWPAMLDVARELLATGALMTERPSRTCTRAAAKRRRTRARRAGCSSASLRPTTRSTASCRSGSTGAGARARSPRSRKAPAGPRARPLRRHDGPDGDARGGATRASASWRSTSPRRCSSAGGTRRRTRRSSSATRWRCPSRTATFAAVVCGFGVRNFADPVRGAREALRVLRPGGVFVTLELFRADPRWRRGAFIAAYAQRRAPGGRRARLAAIATRTATSPAAWRASSRARSTSGRSRGVGFAAAFAASI